MILGYLVAFTCGLIRGRQEGLGQRRWRDVGSMAHMECIEDVILLALKMEVETSELTDSRSWKREGKGFWRNAALYICFYAQSLSCVWFLATPWTVARQLPLAMGFSRQEYWSGLPFPRSFSRGSSWPRDHAHISALAGRFCTPEPPGWPT